MWVDVMGKPIRLALGLTALLATGAAAQDDARRLQEMQAGMARIHDHIHAHIDAQGQMRAMDAPETVERQKHTVTDGDLLSVVMPGVSLVSQVQSFLRFSNGDSRSGEATVELRDPATGEGIVAWVSPAISGGGTLEVAVADILKAGTPIHQFARLPATVVAEVEADFIGHVQHVTLTAGSGALNNVSTCGMVLMADALSLPYVSGPGRDDVVGQLRVTNATATARSLTVIFLDNAGHASVWTSPTVAPMGSFTRAIANIAPQAAPPIEPKARSLSVIADYAPHGLTLSYSEGLVTATSQDDFSAACMLTSAALGPDHDAPGQTAVPATPPPMGGGMCDMMTDMSCMMM